jgi:hypothetical protein
MKVSEGSAGAIFKKLVVSEKATYRFIRVP